MAPVSGRRLIPAHTGLQIRYATPADAPGIAAVYDPVVRDTAISFELEPPGPGVMATRIESVGRTHPWIVVVGDGEVAGYAYASGHRLRPAYRWATETTIYLHPDWRGRGVGTTVYSALLELAALWGFTLALAGVALPNPVSERLHRSLGFERSGVFPRVGYKLGEWWDVAWWTRPLSTDPAPGEPCRPPETEARLLFNRHRI